MQKLIVINWTDMDKQQREITDLALKSNAENRKNRERQKAIRWTKIFLKHSKRVTDDAKLQSIRRARDQYIAHSLTENAFEAEPLPPMQIDDMAWILKYSMRTVCWMRLGISGLDVDYQKTLDIARQSTGFLWDGVKINVVR